MFLNAGGKLPITWYPQEFTRIPMTDMRMRPAPSSGYPGRTYRFYNGRKVFEFGYGLSYTHYSYEFVSVTQDKLYLNQSISNKKVDDASGSVGFKSVSDLGSEFCNTKMFSATVGVRNSGNLAGKHPVLLFARQERPGNGSPVKQLVAFQTVKLEAGEKAELEFMLNPCEHFSSANEDGLMGIEEGSYHLMVGDVEYPLTVIL